MDFSLKEEHVLLRNMLQKFLLENYSHEKRREVLAADTAYDRDIFAELAELGILGALFAEANGGLGGTGFDLSIVFEELGRAGVIEPILGNAVLAGGLVAERGSELDKALLADLILGKKILAFAHAENESRYDLAHVSASAQLDGNAVILNGTKVHVINGAEAGTFVVSARETGGRYEREGISLFLVSTDAEGVRATGVRNIDGTAAATVVFDDVRLDATARLGGIGTAYTSIETAVARATLAVCAEAVGAMEAAKTLTINYLKERQQFGTPIGKFQALQHRMADMLIEVEQARSAVINLAGHIDAPRNERERFVSAAKNLIGRAGALVAEECVQLHGGIGMTEEYALSHYAKRLIMIDHQFGDVDHHLERFISLSAA